MSKTETTETIESKIEKMEVVGEAERIKKIEKKIIEEAEEKVRSIVKEAEKIRKEVLEQKRKEGEGEAEKIIRSRTEEADSLKRQKIAEARLKAKQMIIAAREDLINEAIEKSKEKLLELTASKQYIGILGKLIEEGAVGLSGGELQIVLAGKDQKISIDLDSVSKRVEKETGKKTSISVSQGNVRSIGGVITRKTDGSIMIDNTFEARIERALRDIRMQVAKVLFE
nr:V-type ATP synthase subunit E family protein [Candidatus Njordarchaeum guaymaensis]